MVWNLADGTDEQMVSKEAGGRINHEVYDFRCMSFCFAKASLLLYLGKMISYLQVSSPKELDSLLNRNYGPHRMFA